MRYILHIKANFKKMFPIRGREEFFPKVSRPVL